MARAPKLCSQRGCLEFQPCPIHQKAWTRTRPRGSTLSGSVQQKRAKWVIARDNTICHVCGYPGAQEADHLIPLAEGGPDTDTNMRAIHTQCHKAKTQQEAQRGRHG